MKSNYKKTSSKLPAISTASLPDIVFILLFFFMTVTVIQDKNLLVDNVLPNSNQSENLISKNGVIDIYIGKPVLSQENNLGVAPRVQMNGKFIEREEVAEYVLSELSKMPESLKKTATVSLKVDKKVSMGVVNDIKEELKSINMLKINYATLDGHVLPLKL